MRTAALHNLGCKVNSYEMCIRDRVAGIRRFLEDCSISQEEIMAFGDGENDMDMLKFAGTGIAMGNADTQVTVSYTHLSLSVACHIGPGALAVAVTKKIDAEAERSHYGK